ncbi:MAG: hypothetical protein MKZ95_03935 [Pirellulales bacterium]|nr:hypothetical protein [Pirellulales bacterium]
MFEQIEKVKQEYTDKYVVVDGQRAELARFKDIVGQVKTVNMGGRALVEFMDYHLNIGWYDIDLDYLKVVDKPAPTEKKTEKKPAAKPAAKKPASSEKKLSPLEMARQADSGGKSDSGSGPKTSTADILAAARGEKKESSPAKAESGTKSTSPGSSSEEKLDRSKMSVADMLAAARGDAAATTTSDLETADSSTTDDSEASQAVPAETEQADEAGSSAVGPIDKSSMSIDAMVAYCREKDA